eukprot:gene1183-4397_t
MKTDLKLAAKPPSVPRNNASSGIERKGRFNIKEKKIVLKKGTSSGGVRASAIKQNDDDSDSEVEVQLDRQRYELNITHDSADADDMLVPRAPTAQGVAVLFEEMKRKSRPSQSSKKKIAPKKVVKF